MPLSVAMREDVPMYERFFAMEDYAEWSTRDKQDPHATPPQIADWLVAVEDDAGIDDEAAEQAKSLMALFGQ